MNEGVISTFDLICLLEKHIEQDVKSHPISTANIGEYSNILDSLAWLLDHTWELLLQNYNDKFEEIPTTLHKHILRFVKRHYEQLEKNIDSVVLKFEGIK